MQLQQDELLKFYINFTEAYVLSAVFSTKAILLGIIWNKTLLRGASISLHNISTRHWDAGEGADSATTLY